MMHVLGLRDSQKHASRRSSLHRFTTEKLSQHSGMKGSDRGRRPSIHADDVDSQAQMNGDLSQFLSIERQ